MNVYFLTLGCRVNQYETDAARNLFIKDGFTIVDSPDKADICVVNTCTVTSEADRKSGQSLRKCARANPDSIVVAMGCAAEMKDGKIDADVVCGTKNKSQIVELVKEYLANHNGPHSHLSEHKRPDVSKSDDYHDFGTVLSPEGTRAYIKIEDGCNQFCTYCIIPFARGRVASRDFDDIIREANYLAENGYREVIISGIHACSYGKDRGEDVMALYRVLKAINDIDGIDRIRMGSLEPISLTDEFISSLKNVTKLCPHFHLSLQSGCDKTLKAMNRNYNCEQYKDRVNKLREVYPDMSLTTDIICGFPGETEEDFEETIKFATDVKFSKIHVFPYSVREGTVAAKMPDQINQNVKKERARELIGKSEEMENAFAKSLVGKKVRVLLETSKDGIFEGYTEQYVRALVKTNAQKGEIVEGVVTSCEGNTVYLSL